MLLSEHKNSRMDFDGQTKNRLFFLDWKNKVEGFPPLSPTGQEKRKKNFRTVRDAHGPPPLPFFSLHEESNCKSVVKVGIVPFVGKAD